MALTTLNLSSNRITKLPDWIGGMTALTTLYLFPPNTCCRNAYLREEYASGAAPACVRASKICRAVAYCDACSGSSKSGDAGAA